MHDHQVRQVLARAVEPVVEGRRALRELEVERVDVLGCAFRLERGELVGEGEAPLRVDVGVVARVDRGDPIDHKSSEEEALNRYFQRDKIHYSIEHSLFLRTFQYTPRAIARVSPLRE
jgi:hypothetical protein